MNIEDLWIESPEVENTSKVSKESAFVSARNNFGDSYVGGSLWPVLYELFFSNNVTVQPHCPDYIHF
jgi:hypothetical protein